MHPILKQMYELRGAYPHSLKREPWQLAIFYTLELGTKQKSYEDKLHHNSIEVVDEKVSKPTKLLFLNKQWEALSPLYVTEIKHEWAAFFCIYPLLHHWFDVGCRWSL